MAVKIRQQICHNLTEIDKQFGGRMDVRVCVKSVSSFSTQIQIEEAFTPGISSEYASNKGAIAMILGCPVEEDASMPDNEVEIRVKELVKPKPWTVTRHHAPTLPQPEVKP